MRMFGNKRDLMRIKKVNNNKYVILSNNKLQGYFIQRY